MQNIIYSIAFILAIIGAINWGASALQNQKGGHNLVHKLLGDRVKVGDKDVLVDDMPKNWNKKELTVYALVAIAGIVALVFGWKHVSFKN